MKDNFKNYSTKKIYSQRNKILLSSNTKQNKLKNECITERTKFQTAEQSKEAKKSNLTRIIKPNFLLTSFSLKNSFSPIPKPKKNVKTKICVLDLDETLIHVSPEKLNNINLPQYKFYYSKENNNNKNNKSDFLDNLSAYLIKRPYLDEFFNRINKVFKEIIIFTSSKKSYADAILKIIDEKKIISKCFYRDDCKYKEIGLFFKDLAVVNNNIHNVIIVDNNPNNFSLQRNNGLPISPFEFNENDKELLEISYILEKLVKYNDVREIIPLIIDIDGKINYDKAFELFKNKDVNLDYDDNKNIHNLSNFEFREKSYKNLNYKNKFKNNQKFIDISLNDNNNKIKRNKNTSINKNNKIIYKSNKKLSVKPNGSFRTPYQKTFICTFNNDSKKSLLKENKSDEKLKINSSRNDSIKFIKYKPNILLIEKLKKNTISNSSKKIKHKFINNSINLN